jgi:hypothetical protein
MNPSPKEKIQILWYFEIRALLQGFFHMTPQGGVEIELLESLAVER